ISMDLIKLVPAPDIAQDYLYGMLRWSGFADEVKQHANGANVLHLNPERIGDFFFPLAPKALRDQYGELCDSAHQQCDLLQRRNANVAATRDLLLPKLISGELDVSRLQVAGELAAV